MTKAEHLEVLRYLMDKTEKPVAALQRGVYAANYEIKLIDNAISLMGLCMFGKKRKNKRELKRQKECVKEYVMVLESILCMQSNMDWIAKIKVAEKYAVFSKTKLL